MTHARLTVICGPMFAGKTTELIRQLDAAAHAGRKVFAFKPASDTRYGQGCLATHAGGRFPARGIADEIDGVLLEMGEGALAGIDEAHFFGTAIIEPVREALGRGVSFILAGVERDHRGRPFEPFPTLLCEADEVIKLHAACAVCGGPAVHSQRMIPGDAAIVVGGAESYQARCRNCFRPGS